MNAEFDLKTRARRARNRNIEQCDKNGWLDAYKNIDGKSAYRDGMTNGYHTGYTEGCLELKNHIRFVLSKNPNTTLNEFYKLIKED